MSAGCVFVDQGVIQGGAEHPRHHLGSGAKILLTSVFGPYAQDDEYGSRTINPMELWHNQVTRLQGGFSLRMFHRSWGLMLIQDNIQAECAVLDFPTLERFEAELRATRYDVVGISSIIVNVLKVAKMCTMIRQLQPHAKIVVGGHVASIPDLPERIDADYVVRGDGVRWFRRYLGEDENRPVRHPHVFAGFDAKAMGLPFSSNPRYQSATVIPSVGCPLGCNFCSTSAMFGGKGKSVDFFETGDKLFEVMADIESDLQVQSFFVMDENFLLYRKRALRLLELMRQHDKAWSLYVFSSANAIRMYSMDELVALGLSWAWLGLEGKNSQYSKLNGADTFSLVRDLQANGVRVLGSTIIGLEEHTPENIDDVISYAVSHDTDFHQFMLYTPLPGTALHREMLARGSMLSPDDMPEADMHGQFRFNYRHASITGGQEEQYLLRAFRRDFEVNGPSIARLVRTVLAGWRKNKNHPEARVRRRFRWEVAGLGTVFAGAVWAARHWAREGNPAVLERLDGIYADLRKEFGWRTALSAPLLGRYILGKLRKEEARLAGGVTYEPETFFEKRPRRA